MAEFVYPDMDYQEKVYYEMLWKFQGEDLNTPKNHKTLKGKIKKCKCPSCGRHCASFFRSQNDDTFIMSCMEGCGFTRNLHQLVLELGDNELKKNWKSELKRLNVGSEFYREQFKKYGSALPIKNAGRPKGSKTNKHRIKPITGMTDEILRLRIRGTL